jgi:hypothetical protein
MGIHSYDPRSKIFVFLVSGREDTMKHLALAIVLALSISGEPSAQEPDRTRVRQDDPVPAATSPLPRVERREPSPAPLPAATAVPGQSPAQYNVEDPHAVVDWFFNRSAVRGR